MPPRHRGHIISVIFMALKFHYLFLSLTTECLKWDYNKGMQSNLIHFNYHCRLSQYENPKIHSLRSHIENLIKLNNFWFPQFLISLSSLVITQISFIKLISVLMYSFYLVKNDLDFQISFQQYYKIHFLWLDSLKVKKNQQRIKRAHIISSNISNLSIHYQTNENSYVQLMLICTLNSQTIKDTLNCTNLKAQKFCNKYVYSQTSLQRIDLCTTN
eukprot:TRINITY_DN1375_c1_g1_i5.p1 TRINITY_DN1375_c1_g1~~TRINITY_DN1375_c1_g1_i5.p1  ORF type:complete len:215 (-),score=-31.66 TRINITY_DN1375_c1_g1_i5:98-742(-)